MRQDQLSSQALEVLRSASVLRDGTQVPALRQVYYKFAEALLVLLQRCERHHDLVHALAHPDDLLDDHEQAVRIDSPAGVPSVVVLRSRDLDWVVRAIGVQDPILELQLLLEASSKRGEQGEVCIGLHVHLDEPFRHRAHLVRCWLCVQRRLAALHRPQLAKALVDLGLGQEGHLAVVCLVQDRVGLHLPSLPGQDGLLELVLPLPLTLSLSLTLSSLHRRLGYGLQRVCVRQPELLQSPSERQCQLRNFH